MGPFPPHGVGNTAPKLILKSEAAQHLNVSERTVERRARAGHLTKYRLGPKAVRFDLTEVIALSRPIAEQNGDAE